MALLNPGYWPATYWPAGYWDPNFWPRHGFTIGREHFQTKSRAVNAEAADRVYRRQTKKRIYRFQSKES